MTNFWRTLPLLSLAVSGCGLSTPENHPFQNASVPSASGHTLEGNYTDAIVYHVICEISEGLVASQRLDLPWLNKWGVTITQSITVADQTGVSPGVTLIQPLNNFVKAFAVGGNVTLAQSASQSIGVTASANALRTETLQYTLRNSDILARTSSDPCDKKGFLIDGDLKIKNFIYDNASVAAGGRIAPLSAKIRYQYPIFNVFTEEITFVAAFGGTFTPTWKLARIQANASSNLFISERTTTNDLVITLGPLDAKQDNNSPVRLTADAQNQHGTRVQAAAIAVSIQG